MTWCATKTEPPSDDFDEHGSVAGLAELPLSNAVWNDLSSDATEHPFDAQELERYRDSLVVAQGGMGRVSSVTDTRLRREVAIKEVVACVDDAAGEGLQWRLAQEAWITAQLEHPGIVTVYDAGRNARGRLFFTMRLIRGASLAETLAAGKLSQTELLRHFLAVCQAIAYAHSMGVVHRDLKPANIMLGEFGVTQVVDWGVARFLKGPAAHEVFSETPQSPPDFQTQVGQRVGTPAYMSPEQAAARPATRASDVWSLGAILFELLSGRRFASAPAPVVGPVSGEDVPAELAAILNKALQSEAADRYDDANSLAKDVAAYLDGRPVAAHDYSAWEMARRFARTFRLPLLLGLAALVTASVVFALAYSQTLDEQRRAQAAEQRASGQRDRAESSERATSQALRDASAAIQAMLVRRAEEALAYGAQAEAETLAANALIHANSARARGVLARYSTGSRLQLAQLDESPTCVSVHLSPDGRRLLCLEETATSLWSYGPLRILWRIPRIHSTASFVSETLMLLSASTGQAEVVAVSTGLSLGFWPWVVSRSFSGQTRSLVDDGTSLWVWNRAHNTVIRSIAPARRPRAVSGDGNVGLLYDQRAGRPTLIAMDSGDTRQLAKVPFVDEGPISAALDRRGRLAAFGGTKGTVVVVGVDDGKQRWRSRVTNRSLVRVMWSPGGRWLAVVDERGFVVVFDASGTKRLVLPRLRVDELAWRMLGDRLALVTHGSDLRTYLLPVTLSANTYRATAGIASLGVDRLGRRIALPDGEGAVRVYDVVDGTLLGEIPGGGGAVAKDADFGLGGGLGVSWTGHSKVALWSGRSGDPMTEYPHWVIHGLVGIAGGDFAMTGYLSQVGWMNATGTGSLAETSDGGALLDMVGAPDGRTLAWVTSKGAVDALNITAVSGRPRNLVRRPRNVTRVMHARRVAISPDAKMLAVATPQEVVLIETETGKHSGQRSLPGGGIREVALSAGGWVGVGTIDGRVVIWDEHGRLVLVGAGHRERVSGMAFGPQGRWLVSASWAGVAIRWDLTSLDEDPTALSKRLRRVWGVGLGHAQSADLR